MAGAHALSLLKHPLLLDENIHRGAVMPLRHRFGDVSEVVELGLGGADDVEIARYAAETGRIVVTHDADLAMLVSRGVVTNVGIIYLRPGGFRPEQLLATLDQIHNMAPDLAPPFVVVVDYRPEGIRFRVRSFPVI